PVQDVGDRMVTLRSGTIFSVHFGPDRCVHHPAQPSKFDVADMQDVGLIQPSGVGYAESTVWCFQNPLIAYLTAPLRVKGRLSRDQDLTALALKDLFRVPADDATVVDSDGHDLDVPLQRLVPLERAGRRTCRPLLRQYFCRGRESRGSSA